MKLSELWEQDKPELLRRLSGADAARGEEQLQRELERMLFAYNDACPASSARDEAAALLRALGAALPLVDTAGEVRVWERKAEKRRLPTSALALLIAGAVICLAAGVWTISLDGGAWLRAALPVLGGALLFLAAWAGNKAPAAAPERKTEVAVDWEKVCRVLGTAAQVLDQSLDEASSRAQWEQRRQAQSQLPLSTAETELFEGLLEGLYSGDGAYALERLELVRHYLHGRGVLISDYSGETAALFDCMPGAENATLRPALTTAAGTVLSRGLTVRRK